MLKKSLLFFVAFLLALQFIPLEKTNPKSDATLALHADAKVMQVLKKSCYDCHSNATEWSIYSDIAPLSFIVHSHVDDARKALNFSEWQKISKDIKIARLKRTITTLKLDMMPLSSYLMFHQEKSLSSEDKKVLTQWCKSELKSLGVDTISRTVR